MAPQAENVKVNPVDGYNVRFPPFPQPPDDVRVTAYTDFKEGGIRVNPGSDDTEVDSLGIPTIRMRVGHDTDACKTNTKRKREREEKKAGKESVRKVSKEWWDVWAETEEIRYSVNFDPRSTRFERIQAATIDFTKDRVWPAQTKSETGPKFIWEKFLRYIGLPEGYMPIAEQSQSKKKKRELKEADDDSMSDDSDVEGNDEPADEMRVDDERTVSNPTKKALSNEEKLVDFLDNPEKSIRIFMSSYSWTKGYVWSEDNLLHIPRLLLFFVQFLIRSKVFPESDCDRHLRRSLDTIKAALVELPNSAKFMKLVPDKFGIGCNGCFGKKADGYSFADAGDDFPNTVVTDATTKLLEEPQEKRQKVEAGNTDAAGNNDAHGKWGNSSPGWGSGDGGWGDPSSLDATNAWSSEQLEQLAWEPDEKEQPLFEFLGPSAFPLTHTTGVVERSMRRVKAILSPEANPPPSQPIPKGGPNAMAVEIELDHNFSKLVLAPMLEWDNGEAPVYSEPKILASSRGPVIQTVVQAEGGSTGTSAGVKPHNPLNDDITVLIENAQANLLREGMGVGGTWVQLVRQSDQEVKKKKGKSKKAPAYWYLEEAAFITVSYWSYQ